MLLEAAPVDVAATDPDDVLVPDVPEEALDARVVFDEAVPVVVVDPEVAAALPLAEVVVPLDAELEAVVEALAEPVNWNCPD